jgi:predicted nucleic acid-binding protein
VVKFAFDTNLYVRAIRDAGFGEQLKEFYQRHSPRLHLSSVVLHELLVGAGTPAKARAIREDVARPAAVRERIVTPSHAAWDRAAEALNALSVKYGLERRTLSRSLVNDALIAASCAEAGVTLLTDNLHDFERLSERIPVRFARPWTMEPGGI